MSAQGYSYQVSWGSPRVWVLDGCQCIGWLDPETKQLVRFATEEQANEMLADAIKKKPPTSKGKP